jgi:hypothetical protein
MNRVRAHTHKSESDHFQPQIGNEMTRKEKTNSILSDILPTAINLGLSLNAADKTDTKRPTKGGRAGRDTKGPGSAGTLGAAGASGAVGTLTGVGSVAGWATVAAGVMGAIDIAQNWGRSTPARGAASGLGMGAMVGTLILPGLGTALGAAVGMIGGGLIGAIKTGKHKDQKMRDQVRALLMERGVIDSNYSVGLADGTRFNIGYDGGPKKELGGRRPFEIDPSNPLTKYAVSWLNPVVAALSQGNEKVQSDFVGYFTNAAVSNAKSLNDVKANVSAIIKQFGVNDKQLAQSIVQAAQSGSLDKEVAKAWLNGISERGDKEFKGARDIDGTKAKSTSVNEDAIEEE